MLLVLITSLVPGWHLVLYLPGRHPHWPGLGGGCRICIGRDRYWIPVRNHSVFYKCMGLYTLTKNTDAHGPFVISAFADGSLMNESKSRSRVARLVKMAVAQA